MCMCVHTRNGKVASLEELSQAYSECAEKTVEADMLKQFVKPIRYCWYWEAGIGFKPYKRINSKDKRVCNSYTQSYLSKFVC